MPIYFQTQRHSAPQTHVPNRRGGPGLFLALAFALQTAVIHAVPANDNFAARAVLSPGMQLTIDNTGATLESGEPIPAGFTASNYQATAWWSFSPAAFDGWYEIATTGSAIDTVLAIWTGSSFSPPLTLVHVNDEAVEGGVSRIRFFASASVSYKIAVASRTGARGTVKVSAALTQPFAEVVVADPFEGPPYDEPVFAPVPANVGGASANLTAHIAIDSTRVINSGSLVLFGPSGAAVSSVPVNSANLSPDTPISHGVYIIPFTIPANSPPGAYRWSIDVHHDNNIPPTANTPDVSYGWGAMTPLPFGLPTTITVISDSYAAWQTATSISGSDAVRSADYDKDGLKNLTEFACGTDPRVSSTQSMARSGNTITRAGVPLVSTVGTGSDLRLRVEFIRRLNDPSLTYTVQFSNDLVNWSDATNPPVVIATGLGLEAAAVEDTVIIPVRARRFGRVRVVQ